MTRLPASFEELKASVRAGLAAPLPGTRGHLGMAPRPRRPLFEHPSELRRAAGLLLLYPVAGAPYVLLTVRAGALARHGGQVSLPGGGGEPSESIHDAALRETLEECGVAPASVEVLGGLTPIQIPVSRFLLYPVIGVASDQPAFRLDTGEVARVVEASLTALTNPANLGRRRQTRDGLDIDVPYFDVSGTEVWGATAMILSEFLHLLGYEPDPWSS